MSKQIGAFKAKGTMDYFTLMKGKNGATVRMKGGVDGNRIQKDPAFARTRENGQEFGRGAKRGQLVRSSLRSLISYSRDSKMVSRIVQTMMQVLYSDPISDRAQRDVIEGNLNLLRGFDFNIYSPLSTSLFMPYTVDPDRVKGDMTLSFAEYLSYKAANFAEGSSHFKFAAGCSEIDRENASFANMLHEGSWQTINDSLIPASSIVLNFSANSTASIIGVLGIEFGQEINEMVRCILYKPLNTKV